MSVVEDVKRTVGKKRLHDARVDERDHGVVVSGEDKGGLSDEWQGREARPAGAGEELEVGRLVQLRLHDMVGVLPSAAAQVPAIYLVPRPEPDAFAVAYGRELVLGVTDGLLKLMGTRELTGVLAHEISHLRNGDTRIMMLSDVVGRFVQLLSYVGLWSMALTVPMSVAAQEPVLVLASALLLVVPTLVTLLQLALSRSRELDADLDGATLTGDPEGLARGLLLIERAGGRGWRASLW